MTQVFVDADGVLADLVGHYEKTFGIKLDKASDNIDHEKIRSVPGFYASIPPMHDARRLWDFLTMYLTKPPIILTGIPNAKKVPEAADNKREMLALNFGASTKVICCRSSEKRLHAEQGDILIDDWERYKDLWVKRGGRWITHTSAESSIDQLKQMWVEP